MIRRSRGYAPLPFMTKADWKGQVLAVGGGIEKYLLHRCGQQVLSVTICGRSGGLKNGKGIAGDNTPVSDIAGSKATGCGL